MPDRSLTVEQVLTLLAATPQRIAALTADVSPAQLRTRPTPDEWSANEVLAHLRACADMWGNCIVAMIAEDRPTLDPLLGEVRDGVVGPGRAEMAAAMGSPPVVMALILGQDRPQMPPAESQPGATGRARLVPAAQGQAAQPDRAATVRCPGPGV